MKLRPLCRVLVPSFEIFLDDGVTSESQRPKCEPNYRANQTLTGDYELGKERRNYKRMEGKEGERERERERNLQSLQASPVTASVCLEMIVAGGTTITLDSIGHFQLHILPHLPPPCNH